MGPNHQMVPEQVWSAPALAVVLLCVGLWARWASRGQPDDEWSTAIDVPLAALCGIGLATASAGFLASTYIVGGFDSDAELAVYCAGLGSLRDDLLMPTAGKLSPLAGFLLLPFAHWFGVLPALVAGAAVSSSAFGTGLFLWARASAGRMAGVAAVLFAAANHHLVLLVRTPSFYPETAALCVLGVAGAAAALRWRTPAALLAGGCGAGLVLAADTRILMVGLSSCAFALLAAVAAPIRFWPGRIARVIVPVAASWLLTSWMYGTVLTGEQAPSGLLIQGAAFLGDVPGFPRELIEPRSLVDHDFTWGVSPIWRIPGAILGVMELTKLVPEAWLAGTEVALAWRSWIYPWMPLYGAAIAALLVGLWHRPWALLAGVGPCLVFVANLSWVLNTLPMGRFLTLGMASVPIVLGIGTAAIGGMRWTKAPAATLTVILALAVMGAVPSYLSPWAAWRTPDCAPGRLVAMAEAMRADSPVALGREGDIWSDPQTPVCLSYAAADKTAGRTRFLPPGIPGERLACGTPAPAPVWAFTPTAK